MPSEAVLTGLAQIAAAIAGFTAITSALTPAGGAWDAGQRLRQRAIVLSSFNVLIECLLSLVLTTAVGDPRTGGNGASS